jgi:2-polyprenyl-3-methyl-5-hydroxy-6-metoxy-1,4-benzoquinol methylase
MTQASIDERLTLQEEQYHFPYHYIAHRLGLSEARYSRVLTWGFEYLCYQYHIAEKIISLRPDSVLEVGCGDGHYLGCLGNAVKHRVGADYSTRAIGFAKAFHPDVEFHACNAKDIDQQFDVVVCIEVLEHIPDIEISDFAQTLFGITKPGGYVVISVPSVVLPLNRKHFRHYTSQLLKSQILESVPSARLEELQYVCKIPVWMSLFQRLTANRYWLVEIPVFSNLIWKNLWERNRIVDEKNGRHIVSVFRRAE